MHTGLIVPAYHTPARRGQPMGSVGDSSGMPVFLMSGGPTYGCNLAARCLAARCLVPGGGCPLAAQGNKASSRHRDNPVASCAVWHGPGRGVGRDVSCRSAETSDGCIHGRAARRGLPAAHGLRNLLTTLFTPCMGKMKRPDESQDTMLFQRFGAAFTVRDKGRGLKRETSRAQTGRHKNQPAGTQKEIS